MRENLHRFFRAARGAGIHVSPAESIDAMRAVAQVGISDRAILRDALLLTLAKSQEEKLALGDCFDLFFSQPEPRQDQSEADNDDTPQDAEQSPSSGASSDSGQSQPSTAAALATRANPTNTQRFSNKPTNIAVRQRERMNGASESPGILRIASGCASSGVVPTFSRPLSSTRPAST